MVIIQSKTGGRAENQDSYGSATTPYGELLLVCDGMGGHKGGKRASEMAVQIIIDEMLKATINDATEALKSAIQLTNGQIIEAGNESAELRKMGTTLVALLITKEKAICCHVGDSRLYHLRGNDVLFRTFDHSHVFELVQAGLLTEEEARLSEKSNIITRALGIDLNLKIETTDNIAYQQGDRFLLCTDGIWGALPENELIQKVTKQDTLEHVVTKLVEDIDAIGWEKGGKHDNLTAAMVEIEPITPIKKGLFSSMMLYITRHYKR